MTRSRQTRGGAVVFSLAAIAACGQQTVEAPASVGDRDTPAPETPAPTPAPTPTPTGPMRPASRSPEPAPRLLAPLSTSISTSQRPMFSWLGGSPAPNPTLDVCRDRACSDIIVSFPATGSSARPPQPLPPGVVFWRVSSAPSGGLTSAVWQLTIPARESGRPGSWGSVPDFNGDGFADLAVGA